MVITSNLFAMNANRMLGITSKDLKKRSEKLSSGYKINRAADDAAGLAISEKMRFRIRGLRQGMDNIQEGISLCNVADGAMEEVHDMLHRMEELAVKAANGTNSEEDRNAINEEIEHLKMEIDIIGSTTTFNEQPVFQGAFQRFTPSVKGEFFKLLGNNVSHTGYMEEPLDPDKLASLNNTGMNAQGDNPFVSVHVDFSQLIDVDKNLDKLSGTQFYINCCTNCCAGKVIFTNDSKITQDDNTLRIGLKKADGQYYESAEEFCEAIVNATNSFASHVEFACDKSTLYIYDIDANEWSESNKRMAYFCDVPEGSIGELQSNFRIQMSDNTSDAMNIEIGSISSSALQIVDNDCLTVENAREFVDALQYANSIASQMRSRIGSYTNRLEHSYNVNANTHENTTAAESRIRDTDIAKEIMEHTKDSILQQAGVSMLSQANQMPRYALQLLT